MIMLRKISLLLILFLFLVSPKIMFGMMQEENQDKFLFASLRCDLKLVKEFVEIKKVDINCLNCRKENALNLAFWGYSIGCSGDEAVIEYLILKGINVNVDDERGKSPLYRAYEKENQKLIKLLLEKGAKIVDKKNNDIALEAIKHKFFSAVYSVHLEEIKDFIERGQVDVNVEDSPHGSTALSFLCGPVCEVLGYDYRAIKYLVSKGAKLGATLSEREECRLKGVIEDATNGLLRENPRDSFKKKRFIFD